MTDHCVYVEHIIVNHVPWNILYFPQLLFDDRSLNMVHLS